MNADATLTTREAQIAELFAWGAAKKEVATKLFVSERTVENHARNIYEKIGCGKVNELSAWWFCKQFGISFDLSPLKRAVISCFFLLILSPQMFKADDDVVRMFRAKARTTRVRRRTDDLLNPLIIEYV